MAVRLTNLASTAPRCRGIMISDLGHGWNLYQLSSQRHRWLRRAHTRQARGTFRQFGGFHRYRWHIAWERVHAGHRGPHTIMLAVLAIIGEGWSCEAGGFRRLESPDDPVRREIETALRHQVPVIPVLVGTAAMPERADLPPSIRSLAARSAIRVTHELFDESVGKLIQTLSPEESPMPEMPARTLMLSSTVSLKTKV
jgi:hypothetical protein